MREVELKAVVPDLTSARRAVEGAGGRLAFAGGMTDRRYDAPDGGLRARDEVLRLRTRRDGGGAVEASLDFKSPTMLQDGYKVREELSVAVGDPDAMAAILARCGFAVVSRIDREVMQYELDGAVIRFERYPRCDDLVEVEGDPAAIERAIAATGLPRRAFTAERLNAFVDRYEARTGARAALSADALGDDPRPGGAPPA